MKKIGKNALILWICAGVGLVGGLGCFATNIGAAVFGLVAAAVLGFFGYKQFTKYKSSAEEKTEYKPTQAVVTPQATVKTEAKLTAQLFRNGNNYELKYNYKEVAIACVDMPEYQPAAVAAKVGNAVVLTQEPTNTYDNNAVLLSLTSGGRLGYLHKGKLQDMANDFLRKGLPVVGIIENQPAKTIKLGFYDIARSEKNLQRLQSKATYTTFKLTGNTGAEMQENIDTQSVGDVVQIEYDNEKEKFLVTNEYGAELGYISSTKLEDGEEYDACVADISQNDNFKNVITIAIFN